MFEILVQQKRDKGWVEELKFFIFFLFGVYTTLKIETGKLNKMQIFKEELQKNVSLQLIHNKNSSKMIRDLSITLQEIATKLCHELYKREPGNLIFLFKLFIRQ